MDIVKKSADSKAGGKHPLAEQLRKAKQWSGTSSLESSSGP